MLLNTKNSYFLMIISVISYMSKWWNENTLTFLRENYVTMGGLFCSKQLNIPIQPVRQKAHELKLRRAALNWSKDEVNFLINNYPKFGSKYCSIKLKCSTRRIRMKAYALGLKPETFSETKICSGCWKEKKLLEFSPHKGARFGVQNKCKKCRAKWESNRKKTDKNYRLEHSIRNRIRMAIKKNVKSGKSLKLLGCDIKFLKSYISKMFQTGMTWENWGEWHLDHRKPCCQFKLSDPKQQIECFHYSNLQPLWAKDNLSKSKKCN